MVKDFTFGRSETMTIKNEKIKGISLDFGTVVTGGATIAALNDLNLIQIDISIQRAGRKEEFLFMGDLDELLTALYAQTPVYEIQKAPFGKTHKIRIDFLDGVCDLKGNDIMKVRLNAAAAAFTALDTSEALTYISAETIPSNGQPTALPVIVSNSITNGSVNVDMPLGNNIHKIVAALDFTATYEASVKAKLETVDILAKGGYQKTVSRQLLETENKFAFDNNPESNVAQMVVFWENKTINQARIKGKLSIPADAYARILTVAFAYL